MKNFVFRDVQTFSPARIEDNMLSAAAVLRILDIIPTGGGGGGGGGGGAISLNVNESCVFAELGCCCRSAS